ncbi:hypothetical protein MHU86_13128 [Fragilaria crotonensis]|nr:hypothetical protein MHU86_13128 [Fragilaria crotonensis]
MLQHEAEKGGNRQYRRLYLRKKLVMIPMRLLLLASLAVSAQSQYPSCSICGDGKTVGAPDVIFSFSQQPDVPCGLLEIAGNLGQITQEQCAFLPGLVAVDCSCQEASDPPAVASPTAAPIAPATAKPIPDASSAPVSDATDAPVSYPTGAPVPDPTKPPASNAKTQVPLTDVSMAIGILFGSYVIVTTRWIQI